MAEELNKEKVVDAALVNGSAADSVETNGTEPSGVVPTVKNQADAEKRVSAAAAKMDENTERARRAAQKLTEEEENVGEYKRRLAEESIRKAELERKRQREEDARAEKERELRRAEEVENYLRARSEEGGSRFRRSEELFGFIKGRIDSRTEDAAEEEISFASEASPDEVQAPETDTDAVCDEITEEKEKNCGSEPPLDSDDTADLAEASAKAGDSTDEKIIISFGAHTDLRERRSTVNEEDGVIRINPYGADSGAYAHPYVFSAREMWHEEQNYPFAPAVSHEPFTDGREWHARREEPYRAEISSAGESYRDYPDEDGEYGFDEYDSFREEDSYESDAEYDERYASLGSESEKGYQSEIEEANRDFAALREEQLSGRDAQIQEFEKAQLPRRLNDFYKREAVLTKEIMKLESRQKAASPEENISIIVEKVAKKKELCELSAEALGACVHVRARTKIQRHRKILEEHITDYNNLCDEYENNTGRPVERIGEDMVNDVLSERVCAPIQKLCYYGVEDEYATGAMDADSDRLQRLDEEAEYVRREYDRYLEGGSKTELTPAEERIAKRRRAERMSAIRRATERDSILIGLRTEYRIAALETKRDMLMSSYGTDRKRSLREKRDVSHEITKIKRKAAKEAKRAREANSRYYLLPALAPEDEKVRKKARRERLESLRLRLDVLLAERESINERLIALYGGSDKKLRNAKIRRKAGAVRRRSAKAMYKKQRNIARKIDRYKAPLDIKERAYELLNKKTAAVATADECRYKLRRMKLTGRAEKELIANIKRSKKTAKQTDKELKYVLKKLKRQEERYHDEREWRFFLVIFIILLAIGAGAWILYGDKITAYLKYLVDWFSSLR